MYKHRHVRAVYTPTHSLLACSLPAAGAQQGKAGAWPANVRESTTQQFVEEMRRGADHRPIHPVSMGAAQFWRRLCLFIFFRYNCKLYMAHAAAHACEVDMPRRYCVRCCTVSSLGRRLRGSRSTGG